MTLSVDVDLDGLTELIDACVSERLTERIWDHDGTVWSEPVEPEIVNRLGWLEAPTESETLIDTIAGLANEAREARIVDVVLCGMGGSSLAPEVFAATLPSEEGYPTLTVMDTTHPDAIAEVTRTTHPDSTWYIISSKSGGTLETMSLFHHFWLVASQSLTDPSSHFLAVTDPGSALEDIARTRGFRAIVLADPNVGGRYSALTAFGLLPAGLIGADIVKLLAAGRRAAAMCGADVAPMDNPGFLTGIAFGARAVEGRAVAYFDGSGAGKSLPTWAEQLIAESTGKDGTGILPVAGGLAPFDQAMVISIGGRNALKPDVAIMFDDPYDVAGAMFILEFATATAGAVMGIHPFDQPDVQMAKRLASQAMAGELEASVSQSVGIDTALETFRLWFSEEPPSYVSVHAYLAPTPELSETLSQLQIAIAEATDTFVTFGYGPRFLHSTGQLHKGGFSGGLFVQLLDTPNEIVPVPDSDFTFNDLIAAQAEGDDAALRSRGRKVMTVKLGANPQLALNELRSGLST